MPWTEARYPPAMRHLPAVTRLKAIEIANALLDDGADDGRAIRIAIAAAKRWAAHHAPDEHALTGRYPRWARQQDAASMPGPVGDMP